MRRVIIPSVSLNGVRGMCGGWTNLIKVRNLKMKIKEVRIPGETMMTTTRHYIPKLRMRMMMIMMMMTTTKHHIPKFSSCCS